MIYVIVLIAVITVASYLVNQCIKDPNQELKDNIRNLEEKNKL